ncbi:MAG TPA: DNA-processing protein DprA [Pseudonocardia sp.]|nr:DNA-processing protein DprA [Pseudonocardia sp.]
MSAAAGSAGAVRRARAYLLRVAEPPASALARMIAALGPVEAAARVRAGAVPESVARETAGRRAVDRVDDDLAAAEACGARLLTPEDPAWPHWAFTALENAAYGPPAADAVGDLAAARDPAVRAACPPDDHSWSPSTSSSGDRAPGERAAGDPRRGDGALEGGAADAAVFNEAVLGGGASGGSVGGGTLTDGVWADDGAGEDAGWPRRSRIGAGARPARGDLAPPIALWVRGSGALDELCEQAAAIVGARAATSYGLHVAGELGAGLAAVGFTVVSGAAIGVDGAAHRGALAAGGASVAVLACGIDRSYPAAHEALLERIVATGLVVSEYPPGSVPARHRFLVRNRLIAGLSGGTVVVEAGLRSGAQRTAADARSLGRPVMAVPGPVTSGRSAGCHRMIRDGAVLVTRVEEVLEEVGRIGLHLAEPSTTHGSRPTDGLSALAVLVHDALPARAAQAVAWLATEAGVPPNAVRSALDELVRRELVEQVGGRWQRPQRG